MSLKDQILKDIGVFLDSNEFGSTHNINGANKTVIVDNELLEEERLKSDEIYGIYSEEILFHIKTSDLPEKPRIEQHMDFDNKGYTVIKVFENEGMYTITIGANRQ